MKMKITKRTLRGIIREELNKIQETGVDPYEHALEAPLEESDFNLEEMDKIAKLQHNLQMRMLDLELWAMDQGYRRGEESYAKLKKK